jgi:hypothetical protein
MGPVERWKYIRESESKQQSELRKFYEYKDGTAHKGTMSWVKETEQWDDKIRGALCYHGNNNQVALNGIEIRENKSVLFRMRS